MAPRRARSLGRAVRREREAFARAGRLAPERHPLGAGRGNPSVAVPAAPPFRGGELEGLAQSIRGKGIVQPLLVRPIDGAAAPRSGSRTTRPSTSSSPASAAGARRSASDCTRSRSSSAAFSDSEAIEIALVENLQRADLSALEEAEAYSRLMRDFGRSQSSLADAVGKSRSHVANTVRLLSLPAPVRRSLESGALSAGHARALLGASDPAALAAEVIRRGLNVRATEEAGAPPPRAARGAAEASRSMPTRSRSNAICRPRLVCASPSRQIARRQPDAALYGLDQLDRLLDLLRRT